MTLFSVFDVPYHEEEREDNFFRGAGCPSFYSLIVL